jgi:NodT family efflux transporter outer membrane factor (OMF) lipoprotein
MYPRLPLALLVGTALITGCAVGPDFHRPDVPLPDHYIGGPADHQANATPSARLSSWWDGFHDPLLSALVSEALEQNLDLAQATARVTQARAGLGAATAALLPSGNVAGQAARAQQSVETPLGQLLNAAPGFDRYGSSYELDLGASWEIDIFGGLRRAREAAVAEYQATEAGVAASRLAVASQTADIYITIRGAQKRLDIARGQVLTQQDLLDKVRMLYTNGLAAEYQLRQAQGALFQAQATVPVLQARLDAGMNALDVMLGTPAGTHRPVLRDAGMIPVAPGIDAAGKPADLLRRRPDLIAAERRLAASNARIGVAIAEYYPKISLGGLLGSATAVSAGNLFTNGASQAAAVLGLRWRLFDFGRINAQIDQAKGQEAEALAGYRQAVMRATQDVEDAFSALANREAQEASLARQESSLSLARQSLFTAYQKGAASLIDVLYTDQALLQSSDARAQAQTESARAAVAAYKALGGAGSPDATGSVAMR